MPSSQLDAFWGQSWWGIPKSGADTNLQMPLGVKETQECDSAKTSQTRWIPRHCPCRTPCWICRLLALCAADSHPACPAPQ